MNRLALPLLVLTSVAVPTAAQESGPTAMADIPPYVTVGRPSQGTVAAVEALMAKLEGWTEGPEQLAGAYAADAELLTPGGRTVRGGAAIEAMQPAAAESDVVRDDRTMRFTPISLRYLGDAAVVFQGVERWFEGPDREVHRSYHTVIMARQGDAWTVVHHAMTDVE